MRKIEVKFSLTAESLTEAFSYSVTALTDFRVSSNIDSALSAVVRAVSSFVNVE